MDGADAGLNWNVVPPSTDRDTDASANSVAGLGMSAPPSYGACHGQQAAATIKIINHPGHYMNHEASHLMDPQSVEYWASLPGHIREQAFVFELEQAQVLSHVEWKDRGDGMGVAKMSLEALVGNAWQKLSVWDAERTPLWQKHAMTMSLRSHQWKLTFLSNHGDMNHLVIQAIRFIVQLPAASPAYNADHSQRITQNLWKDKRFTDVEVVCGSERFAAHRAVLAAASPVFAAMLSTDMRESQSQEIHILDADERAVQDTLEYIYTGAVGEHAGFGMVVLGHKYDIPGLVAYAAPVALGNLTPHNVITEVRTLRPFAGEAQLGLVFEALGNKVHEDAKLFRAMLLGT